MKQKLLLLFVVSMYIVSCNNTNSNLMQANKVGISKTTFGSVDGKEVFLYTLTNAKGNQVKITNYGGIVTSWTFPNKQGVKENIVVGLDSVQQYTKQTAYLGALIGRYGNRIANGKFKIDNVEYTLATNNGKNHLHGGIKGFDKIIWDASTINDSTPALVLNYISKDGEEGYPGNLTMQVKYTFTNDDELEIEYNAQTDKATYVNLTQHNYYNLSGSVTNTILSHTLKIEADNYTPVDSTLIPTGEIKSVKNSAFDFTNFHKIGERIDSVKGGYDHNWVLNKKDASLSLIATLAEETSGRKMEVYTTEPGMQFYTGNFLDGKFSNQEGKPVNYRTALCLETQHFPNSPNQPNFPTTLLKAGEKYHTVTKYKLLLQ